MAFAVEVTPFGQASTLEKPPVDELVATNSLTAGQGQSARW
jgi:hypothetical protein